MHGHIWKHIKPILGQSSYTVTAEKPQIVLTLSCTHEVYKERNRLKAGEYYV